MPNSKLSTRQNKSSKQKAPIVDSEKQEKALVGYQVAVDMWKDQENQGWARFNVLLVVNGLIIAAIGFTSGQTTQPLIELLLPIAGLLISVVWFIFMRREVAWSIYYAMSARELEEKYLSDVVNTAARGSSFQSGNEVTFEIDGKSTKLKMNFLARNIREKAMADWIIAILIFLYIGTIIQSLLF